MGTASSGSSHHMKAIHTVNDTHYITGVIDLWAPGPGMAFSLAWRLASPSCLGSSGGPLRGGSCSGPFIAQTLPLIPPWLGKASQGPGLLAAGRAEPARPALG